MTFLQSEQLLPNRFFEDRKNPLYRGFGLFGLRSCTDLDRSVRFRSFGPPIKEICKRSSFISNSPDSRRSPPNNQDSVMPLPYLPDLKQCTAKAKSTQLRCKNPAAHGCKTCRMHGARKPETIRRGADHPQYRNGNHTLEVRSARQAAVKRLQHLCDLGNKIGLFCGEVKLRGRKPKNNHG